MDEKTQKTVAGALFDFVGFLTTRVDAVTLGSEHDSVPAADLLAEFARLRGLSLVDVDRCGEFKARSFTARPLVITDGQKR